MIELQHKIKKRHGLSLSDSACQQIKETFEISDARGELSLFNGFWLQFWAHQSINTTSGGRVNLYDGHDNGQGVYGPTLERGNLTPVLILPNGKFRLSEKGLPYVAGTFLELTGDMHRANENWALKSLHLMAVLIHNKRMDAHGNFDLAKDETIATLNTVTLNETIELTGLTESQIFNEIRIKDMHTAIEWPNALARWAHAQMPDTVAGTPIFEKRYSIDVDVAGLLTEKSRELSLGVSTAMQNMDHLPSQPHAILERTFAKHVELGLACHQDACVAIDPRNKEALDDAPKGCPLFPAMLMEARDKGEGKLGPVYGRLVADGIAASLMWGAEIGQGLWHPRWENAPDTSAEIVDYAFS